MTLRQDSESRSPLNVNLRRAEFALENQNGTPSEALISYTESKYGALETQRPFPELTNDKIQETTLALEFIKKCVKPLFQSERVLISAHTKKSNIEIATRAKLVAFDCEDENAITLRIFDDAGGIAVEFSAQKVLSDPTAIEDFVDTILQISLKGKTPITLPQKPETLLISPHVFSELAEFISEKSCVSGNGLQKSERFALGTQVCSPKVSFHSIAEGARQCDDSGQAQRDFVWIKNGKLACYHGENTGTLWMDFAQQKFVSRFRFLKTFCSERLPLRQLITNTKSGVLIASTHGFYSLNASESIVTTLCPAYSIENGNIIGSATATLRCYAPDILAHIVACSVEEEPGATGAFPWALVQGASATLESRS